MRKRIMAMLLTVILICTAAACGNGQDAGQNDSSKPEGSGQQADTPTDGNADSGDNWKIAVMTSTVTQGEELTVREKWSRKPTLDISHM